MLEVVPASSSTCSSEASLNSDVWDAAPSQGCGTMSSFGSHFAALSASPYQTPCVPSSRTQSAPGFASHTMDLPTQPDRCSSLLYTEPTACLDSVPLPARFEPLSRDCFTQTCWHNSDQLQQRCPSSSSEATITYTHTLELQQRFLTASAPSLQRTSPRFSTQKGIMPISINIDRDPALFPIILEVYR